MDIVSFQDKVLSFYKENARDLPWRRTADPYRILVSEIMLQQTQVERVIPYYERWIARWPCISDLACAEVKDVLSMWMGLGYNRRSLMLRDTARNIVSSYNGDVLAAMANHHDLVGIGPYTSAAVRIFAANEDIVAVDTNIRRILIHELGLPDGMSAKEIEAHARICLPLGRSREWHNALMDYGSSILTAKKTGIRPVSRQSKFKGSDRELRAKILRLVMMQALSEKEIAEQTGETKARVKKVTGSLVAHRLIEKRGARYQVPSVKHDGVEVYP